jgi:DNA-binding CsgD family transcriptional regulator
MKSNHQMLHAVWNKSADLITRRSVVPEGINVEELMAPLFCPGPSYYYVVDFYDRQIRYMSSEIEKVLGLPYQTTSFNDILAQIHPDDIAYVAQAETTVINYLYNVLGKQHITRYKVGYCFRFKMHDGSFQLFQHQAIALSVDERGGLSQSLNIHTNINHLTSVNNNKAFVAGINGERLFIELDVLQAAGPALPVPLFSKREIEIIRLMAKGLKSQEIANRLSLSLHTVKNHRKNVIRKAGVRTSAELVARCLREGFI